MILMSLAFAARAAAGATQGAQEEKKTEKNRAEIAILLYKGVPGKLVEPLLPALEETFGLPFFIIEGDRKLPDSSFDKERGQYRAAAVLRDVADAKPKRAVRVVGLLSEDFYVRDWNFAFGMASPENAAAVVSVFRLRTDDEAKFRSRLLTEIVHELSHTFGLRHCDAARCAMRFSISIGQVDGKGRALCSACARKLKKEIEALENGYQ